MNASEIMAPHEVWACVNTTDCRIAAQLMHDHNIGCLPVLDQDGRLQGIVTDRDVCCRMVAEGKSFETPVREIMSSPVYACEPDTDVDQVESMMRDNKIRRLPVVDADNKLKGFISLGDLARHGREIGREHLAEVLEAVSATAKT
jgi:CBS-domain-containing membrane protein